MGRGYHLLLQTERFNLSQPKDYYINPECYGDDAAAWLRDRLAELDIGATEPEQEDWGWYIYAYHHEKRYFIGLAGYTEIGESGNRGEWRFMVEKTRSLREMLTGRNRIVESEPIIGILKRIIDAQTDMRFVSIERYFELF